MRGAVDKVTAFITRETAGGRQLLLFRHPLNGHQLPAGTVEIGETPAEAVMREAFEETGLRDLTLIRPLGATSLTLDNGYYVARRTTKLFDAPARDASAAGPFLLTRGSYVRLLWEKDKYAEVLFEEMDERSRPARPVRRERGWVRRSLLGLQLRRHHYWLRCHQATPARWTVAVDRHQFTLFWRPLQPPPALVSPQDEWLAAVYEMLTEREG